MSNFTKGFWLLPVAAGRTAILSYQVLAFSVKLAARLIQGRPKPRNTHGDAAWATIADARPKGLTKPNGGFVLGLMEFRNWYGHSRVAKLYSDPEASVVIFGPRKSGKSQLISANLYALHEWPDKARPDLIVVDATGELQARFETFLKERGYNVRCFDFTGTTKSIRYDPLSTLKLGSPTYAEDLRHFCTLILPDASELRNNHFTVLPRRLLAGSITYHLTCEPEKATLDYCLQAIVRPLKELQENTKKWAALAHDPSIANAITVSKVVADREFSGFITTMTDKFDPFLMPRWRELTQPGRDTAWVPLRGWTFRDVYQHEQPTVLFIRSGLSGEISGPCVRLLIGNAVNERKAMMMEAQGQLWPYGKSLRIFVDEAKNLGNCEGMVTTQNEMRKAGVNMMLAYLSRSTVFQTFPSAKELLAGMTEIYPGGITDWETLQHASRMSGQRTAMAYSESTGRGGGGSSLHEAGVPLIQPDQVGRIPQDKWLVVNHEQMNYIARKPFEFVKGKPKYWFKNLTR